MPITSRPEPGGPGARQACATEIRTPPVALYSSPLRNGAASRSGPQAPKNAFADVGGKDVFSTYTFKVATPLETSSPEKRHFGGEGG